MVLQVGAGRRGGPAGRRAVGDRVRPGDVDYRRGGDVPLPDLLEVVLRYHKLHPNLEINYDAIGSGGGIRQITAQTVFFGASDGPMTDEQLKAAPDHIMHFPTVLGGDVPVYNIPGVTATLRFTGPVLADIFLGKITKWNDPAITKLNPGVALPASDILVVHRSDGSGTTYIWVDYLSKVSPEWKSKVGVATSVNWPVGLGGKGNQGVAGLVRQTPGSIGYVELIYALQNKISYGEVQNRAGKFVKASVETVTNAAAGAATNMPADFRVSITDAPGENTYPISSFTWMLFYQHPAGQDAREDHGRLLQVGDHRRPAGTARTSATRRCRRTSSRWR